jgi:hypothetical protein
MKKVSVFASSCRRSLSRHPGFSMGSGWKTAGMATRILDALLGWVVLICSPKMLDAIGCVSLWTGNDLGKTPSRHPVRRCVQRGGVVQSPPEWTFQLSTGWLRRARATHPFSIRFAGFCGLHRCQRRGDNAQRRGKQLCAETVWHVASVLWVSPV